MRKSDKKEQCPYNAGCACVPWKRTCEACVWNTKREDKKDG